MTAAGRQAFEAAIGHREIGQHELEIEPLEVAPGIDAPFGMRVRRVLERADHVQQGIGVPQPREVFGRQLLGADVALGRRRWRGQVHVGHVGMDDLLRLEDLGQPVESLVGDLDDAHVHGDPAVAAGLGMTSRQRVEDRGLARPGKADDGDLHGQYPAAGSTTLSSVSPRAKRPRLSQNSSMLRSRTRPLDHAVCGVTMTFGRS